MRTDCASQLSIFAVIDLMNLLSVFSSLYVVAASTLSMMMYPRLSCGMLSMASSSFIWMFVRPDGWKKTVFSALSGAVPMDLVMQSKKRTCLMFTLRSFSMSLSLLTCLVNDM